MMAINKNEAVLLGITTSGVFYAWPAGYCLLPWSIKNPAETLDTVRAWVQQYEKYNIPRDDIFCHFQARLEVGTQKHGTGYAAP